MATHAPVRDGPPPHPRLQRPPPRHKIRKYLPGRAREREDRRFGRREGDDGARRLRAHPRRHAVLSLPRTVREQTVQPQDGRVVVGRRAVRDDDGHAPVPRVQSGCAVRQNFEGEVPARHGAVRIGSPSVARTVSQRRSGTKTGRDGSPRRDGESKTRRGVGIATPGGPSAGASRRVGRRRRRSGARRRQSGERRRRRAIAGGGASASCDSVRERGRRRRRRRHRRRRRRRGVDLFRARERARGGSATGDVRGRGSPSSRRGTVRRPFPFRLPFAFACTFFGAGFAAGSFGSRRGYVGGHRRRRRGRWRRGRRRARRRTRRHAQTRRRRGGPFERAPGRR